MCSRCFVCFVLSQNDIFWKTEVIGNLYYVRSADENVGGSEVDICSLPCFPWWRILLFCYPVSALHPPRAPCEPEVCVFPLRAVFFIAFLLLIYFTFLLFITFFRFRFGHRLFHPVFVFFLWVLCCLLGFGFCCDSFRIWYVSWYCLLYTSDAADE